MNFNPSTKKIWLIETITGPFAIKICKEIELAILDESVKLIEILIDCNGGNGTWRLIGSFIESSPKPIHTVVIGQCASAAVYVLQSGHKRYATKFTTFLTHSSGFGLQGKTDHIDKIIAKEARDKLFRDGYLFHKTKLSDETMTELTSGENPFGPKEALEYGFIDGII
ncbi:MAG: ATP-dependent Clp protease proteolytic subunit [Candidatus Parcubacteria bacterium]|nr:ATP-dependent Clp protease proteolytic subunit [Candidatus Paceibacterota bacterium]